LVQDVAVGRGLDELLEEGCYARDGLETEISWARPAVTIPCYNAFGWGDLSLGRSRANSPLARLLRGATAYFSQA
jgi:hypothetical protein